MRNAGLWLGRVGAIGAASLLLASGAASQPSNFARYQFASASNQLDEFGFEFVADGKIGPRNRFLTNDRGRHRVNVFLGEEIELGSVHVYAFAYDASPMDDAAVWVLDPATNQMVELEGASVTGNTAEAFEIILPTPVTTRQVQIRSETRTISVDEIAVFPPNNGQGYPLGTDVNMHQARQHRLALTPASSRANGTVRRAVVDGFVNDSELWRTSGAGPHWIELDVSDPPETTPADVRVSTTPIRVGGAHLYVGTSDGSNVPASGRFQTFDGSVWVDVPGGGFSGNTDGFVSIQFDEPVVSARLRLWIDDTSTVAVREIVPLPPAPDALGWPEGTSVIMGVEPDYRDLGDDYYAITLAGSSLALTSDEAGQTFAAQDAGVLDQQYLVLFNVGSDSYRIVNRSSGLALSVEGASAESGAAVIESTYHALPHQRWRIDRSTGDEQFVNVHSGLAMSLTSDGPGATLEQQPVRTNRPLQRFDLTSKASFGKKGQGGFPQLADQTRPDWAYNWGKDDGFPAPVDYWPMQWGSFFWDRWPERMPGWKRSAEPLVLMGYNEPDKDNQSDIPVQIGIDMWPRMEVHELPLLAPAPVNPTNDWILSFFEGVDQNEYRVEYSAVHWYAGPNADSFIGVLQNTRNTYGLDVVVSEFSVVDWNDTNSWTDEPNYNFFAEVFWRMENLPWLRRYAVFFFTDDPTNPISDNRGEMRFEDGTLTPEGMLFAAWDGDTQIRTDTPYHLHNEQTYRRIGSVAGEVGDDAIQIGDKSDFDEPFRWFLVPTDVAGEFNIASVDDGRIMSFNSRGVSLVDPETTGTATRFRIVEAEHGWFFIEEVLLGRRLESVSGGATLNWAPSNTSAERVRWRLAPVMDGVPAAPRDLQATSLGSGQVELAWASHGFRDLEGMQVSRLDPGGTIQIVAPQVISDGLVDTVPAPGTYAYEVRAIGDTGISEVSSVMVSVETCAADFDGDFVASPSDVASAVTAIGGGLDYNASGQADFFDLVDYLSVFDGGCN